MLDTLWKLYRYPGESKQDVKRRLFCPSETSVEIKQEIMSSDGEYNEQHLLSSTIKQESNVNNDCIIEKEMNKSLQNLDDSDSDPENVSYLIKQEYTMNNYYSDSEEENDSDSENQTKRVLKKEVKFYQRSEGDCDDDSDELDEEYIANEIDNCHIKMESFDEESYSGMNFDNHEQYSLADLLNIEIQENDKENIFRTQNDSKYDDFKNDEINWTFEKSSNTNNNFSLNPLFKPPQLKQLSKKNVLPRKKNVPVKKKRKTTKKKAVPKLVIKNESSTEEKVETSFDPYKPIICDMYGTRTINYNYPPQVKAPKWQSCSKLSDTDSDSELQKPIILNEKLPDKSPNPFYNQKKREDEALELKNYFPTKNKKRKRNGSDTSWSESNISDYSDIDNIDIISLKIKKEKDVEDVTERRRSLRTGTRKSYVSYSYYTSSEDEQIPITKRQYKYTISSDNVLVAVIKREPEEPSTPPVKEESKLARILRTMNLNPVVDLSKVKIEPRSPKPEIEPVIKQEPETEKEQEPETEKKQEPELELKHEPELEPEQELEPEPKQQPDTCVISELKENNENGYCSDSSSCSSSCSGSSCSTCSSSTSSSEDTDTDDKEIVN